MNNLTRPTYNMMFNQQDVCPMSMKVYWYSNTSEDAGRTIHTIHQYMVSPNQDPTSRYTKRFIDLTKMYLIADTTMVTKQIAKEMVDSALRYNKMKG